MSDIAHIPPIAFSPRELAVALRIPRRHVTEAIRDGRLAAYTIGVQRRVLVRDAEDFIRKFPPTYTGGRHVDL